jgi:hypothetical protein
MSKKVDQTFWQKLTNTQVYRYGNLFITVKKDKITNLLNHKGETLPGWQKPKNAFNKWSKRFGLHK